MRTRSFFGPLLLIAIGVVWLLVNMNVIPSENLWALTYIWPYALIVLGIGLILRNYVPAAGAAVSALLILGAILAVIYAPTLGWTGGPSMMFSGDNGGGIPGSGKIETENRAVKDFSALALSYPADVVVRQGNSESLTIEADDNLLPQLSTEVVDGTLVIKNEETQRARRVKPSQQVAIIITVKDLSQIDFSSAGNLQVEGLETDMLDVSLSGAGQIELHDLDVQSLDVSLSGAGKVEGQGTAKELDLHISGVGSFNGTDLQSEVASVRISGAGSATVRVENDLEARVSGTGSVKYYGSPTVEQSVSGVGSVSQAGK